jgi:hypothetical protein
VIAGFYGLSKSGFQKNREEFPEIEEAIEKGRALAQEQIAKALYGRALDGDVPAIKWWEMTRAGKSSKVEIEGEIKSFVVEVPPQAESPEDWETKTQEEQTLKRK